MIFSMMSLPIIIGFRRGKAHLHESAQFKSHGRWFFQIRKCFARKRILKVTKKILNEYDDLSPLNDDLKKANLTQ